MQDTDESGRTWFWKQRKFQEFTQTDVQEKALTRSWKLSHPSDFKAISDEMDEFSLSTFATKFMKCVNDGKAEEKVTDDAWTELSDTYHKCDKLMKKCRDICRDLCQQQKAGELTKEMVRLVMFVFFVLFNLCMLSIS